MTARNDITGDLIATGVNSPAFTENFDRIFRKPKIMTIYGEMDEDKLEKRVVKIDDSDEITNITATEYWLDGELVHRSLAGELVGRNLFPVQESLGA